MEKKHLVSGIGVIGMGLVFFALSFLDSRLQAPFCGFGRSLPGGRNCPDDKIRLLVQTRTAGTVSGKDGKYENYYGGRTEGGSAL